MKMAIVEKTATTCLSAHKLFSTSPDRKWYTMKSTLYHSHRNKFAKMRTILVIWPIFPRKPLRLDDTEHIPIMTKTRLFTCKVSILATHKYHVSPSEVSGELKSMAEYKWCSHRTLWHYFLCRWMVLCPWHDDVTLIMWHVDSEQFSVCMQSLDTEARWAIFTSRNRICSFNHSIDSPSHWKS